MNKKLFDESENILIRNHFNKIKKNKANAGIKWITIGIIAVIVLGSFTKWDLRIYIVVITLTILDLLLIFDIVRYRPPILFSHGVTPSIRPLFSLGLSEHPQIRYQDITHFSIDNEGQEQVIIFFHRDTELFRLYGHEVQNKQLFLTILNRYLTEKKLREVLSR